MLELLTNQYVTTMFLSWFGAVVTSRAELAFPADEVQEKMLKIYEYFLE